MAPVLALLILGAPQEPVKPAAQAPPWVLLSMVQVDPAMVDEFLAVQRELAAHAREAKIPWRTVSRTEVFGDLHRFVIARPVENLASFDEKDAASPELAALNHRARRCIREQTTYAMRNLPDVSNPLPEGKSPDLMVVNRVRVAFGRDQEYLDVMRTDFLPHFDKAGVHHVTGSLAFGGEGGFLHVFYLEDFAALDEGSPVVRALGPEGAQAVTARLSGMVNESELWVARLIPEVSYGPAPPPETTEELAAAVRR